MVYKDNTLYLGSAVICLFIMHNVVLIAENDKSINRLNFHNHGPDAPDHPYTMDGELIHTLDGIGGWY